MYRTVLILVFLFSSLLLCAQDSLTCGFETLFSIKAGMDKADVMNLLEKNYQAKLVNTRVEKLPPYKGSGGDSIINEILTYKRDITPCFLGRNTVLFMEFADNKLYKAYISTEYPKSAYRDMMSNYDSLRKVIKAKWTYEKPIKLSGGNIVGYGYDYSQTKKSSNKTQKVSLHYIDLASNDPNGKYLLEVLWVNLENTRMESSNY